MQMETVNEVVANLRAFPSNGAIVERCLAFLVNVSNHRPDIRDKLEVSCMCFLYSAGAQLFSRDMHQGELLYKVCRLFRHV